MTDPAETAGSRSPSGEEVLITPNQYGAAQLTQMLNYYMAGCPLPVTTTELRSDEALRLRTADFVDGLLDVAKIMRTFDSVKPVDADIRIVRLKMVGVQSPAIVRDPQVGMHDADAISSSAANGRVISATQRLVKPLHDSPQYRPDTIVHMFERFRAGDDQAIPLPPMPTLPKRPDSAPRQHRQPYGRATADELSAMLDQLARLETIEPQTQGALAHHLLNGPRPGATASQVVEAGVIDLSGLLDEAVAYVPRFRHDDFNKILRMRPQETELLRIALSLDGEDVAMRGFARVFEQLRHTMREGELRASLIRAVHRMIVIPSPDQPPLSTGSSRNGKSR